MIQKYQTIAHWFYSYEPKPAIRVDGTKARFVRIVDIEWLEIWQQGEKCVKLPTLRLQPNRLTMGRTQISMLPFGTEPFDVGGCGLC